MSNEPLRVSPVCEFPACHLKIVHMSQSQQNLEFTCPVLMLCSVSLLLVTDYSPVLAVWCWDCFSLTLPFCGDHCVICSPEHSRESNICFKPYMIIRPCIVHVSVFHEMMEWLLYILSYIQTARVRLVICFTLQNDHVIDQVNFSFLPEKPGPLCA